MKNPHWMTVFSKQAPAGPTPLAIATDSGRKAERSDVLAYLVALATATGCEELWEASTHIQQARHVRTDAVRIV